MTHTHTSSAAAPASPGRVITEREEAPNSAVSAFCGNERQQTSSLPDQGPCRRLSRCVSGLQRHPIKGSRSSVQRPLKKLRAVPGVRLLLRRSCVGARGVCVQGTHRQQGLPVCCSGQSHGCHEGHTQRGMHTPGMPVATPTPPVLPGASLASLPCLSTHSCVGHHVHTCAPAPSQQPPALPTTTRCQAMRPA